MNSDVITAYLHNSMGKLITQGIMALLLFSLLLRACLNDVDLEAELCQRYGARSACRPRADDGRPPQLPGHLMMVRRRRSN